MSTKGLVHCIFAGAAQMIRIWPLRKVESHFRQPRRSVSLDGGYHLSEVSMNLLQRVRTFGIIAVTLLLLLASWATTALAQVTDADGDGLDGDELSPAVLILGLVVVGWIAFRARSRKSN